MNLAPGWYPDNAEVRMGGTGQDSVARQVQRAGLQGVVGGVALCCPSRSWF